MKPTLIVVKSPQNDKNSESYLKRIKSYWKDYYDDGINLDIPKEPFETQEQLNKYLKRNSGSVLLLHPTELKLYGKDQMRNIENDQVVSAVLSLVPPSNYCSKVLIVGSGNIGTKLCNELRFNGKVVATCSYGDIGLLDEDFLNKFDLLINCTRYDANVELFYSKMVIDVAGNFKPLIKKYWDDINIEYSEKPNPTIIRRGAIGIKTADLMLQDVIENGF